MDFRYSIRLVLAGSVLSLTLVVALVFHLMNTISSGVNAQDYIRSSRAVEAALASERSVLAGLVRDNAEWNDAVREAYGDANKLWLKETWGVATIETNYDIFLLLDESDRTVVSYVKGEEGDVALEHFVGAGKAKFLDAIPRDGKSRGAVTDIFKVGDTIVILAASPIVPLDDAVAIPGPRTRVLVFGKHIDPETVKNLEARSVVSDLRFSDAAPTDETWSFVPVRNAAGDIVTYAAWLNTRPGDLVRKDVELPTMLVLVGLIGTTLWLISLAWRAGNELRRREELARIAARQDALTLLPNRLALFERLSEVSAFRKGDVALLFVDLDGFKDVNDTYGHEAGDALLKKVARAFQERLGPREMLARLGGDEFAVVIEQAQDAGRRGMEAADALVQALSDGFDLERRRVSVGASVGLATFSSCGGAIDELIRRADVAMYRAKGSGRNRVCRYEPELEEERNKAAQTTADLHRVLEEMSLPMRRRRAG